MLLKSLQRYHNLVATQLRHCQVGLPQNQPLDLTHRVKHNFSTNSIKQGPVSLVSQIKTKQNLTNQHLSLQQTKNKSIIKISDAELSHIRLSRKLRVLTSLDEVIEFLQNNFQEINSYNKTLVLDVINQFYLVPTSTNLNLGIKLINILDKFDDLKIYQMTVRLSMLQKVKIFYSKLKNMEQFYRLRDKFMNSIIESLNTQQNFSFYELINVLIIFRIQTFRPLILKTLELLTKRVNSIQLSSQAKMWNITIYQLGYLSWRDFRKFPEIQNFIVKKLYVDCNIFKSNYISNNVKSFKDISCLQLHLVGPRKIPVCFKQFIQSFKKHQKYLKQQQICILLSAYSYLPASFQPQFKSSLVKQLSQKKYNFHKYSEIFPYKAFTTQQLNNFYTKDFIYKHLWSTMVYHRNDIDRKEFFRGNILKFLKEICIQKIKQVDKTWLKTQNISRILQICQFFLQQNQEQSIQACKQTLQKYFQDKSIRVCMNQCDINSFIVAIQLFQDNNSIEVQIRNAFHSILEVRNSREDLFQNNLINYLEAIKINIANQNTIVRELVVMIIRNYLLTKQSNRNKTSQVQQLDDKYQVSLLAEIINVKQCNKLLKIKQFLFSKIKTAQQMQYFMQCYILYPKKSAKGVQQILKQILQSHHEKISIISLIKFICSLNPKLILNKKGWVQKSFKDLLSLKMKQPIVDLTHFNQINRFIHSLIRYQAFHKDLTNIYLDVLNLLYQQVINPEFKLQTKSSRVLVQFVFLFQQLISAKQLLEFLQNKFLTKIFKILNKLTKLDTKYYIKAKFIEFVLLYKQYIRIPQGMQIQHESELQNILQKTHNPEEMSQIILIMLKLHCLGLLEMSEKTTNQYITIINNAIISGKISIYQTQKITVSILYSFRTQRVNQQSITVQKFREIMDPIFINSVKQSHSNHDFSIMKPFFIYFKYTKQFPQVLTITQNLLKSYITQTQLQWIIEQLPFTYINADLFDLIVKKVQVMLQKFDSNIVNILFFFQKIFFQTPKKYEDLYEKIWAVANTQLSSKLDLINDLGNLSENDEHKLGRYGLYMFACIRNRRFKNNQIFWKLAQIIKSNPEKFNQKIKYDKFLKHMNLCISNFVQIYQKQDDIPLQCEQKTEKQLIFIKKDDKKSGMKYFKNKSEPIMFMNLLITSKRLQQYLKSQKIEFKIRYFIEGNPKITVPYYLPEKKQVVIVTNKFSFRNSIEDSSEFKANGFLRFQYELYKEILKGYKVRIFIHELEKFIEV